MAATEPGRAPGSCLSEWNLRRIHFGLVNHYFFLLTKSKIEAFFVPLPVREVNGLAVLSADLLSAAQSFMSGIGLEFTCFWAISLAGG